MSDLPSVHFGESVVENGVRYTYFNGRKYIWVYTWIPADEVPEGTCRRTSPAYPGEERDHWQLVEE